MQDCTAVHQQRVVEDPHGLRAQKRQQSRRQIAIAAYDVIRTRGMEALTADAIAVQAGVSRRTFFNYFDGIEDALATGIDEVIGSWMHLSLARPSDEDPIEALLAVLSEPLDVEWLRQAMVLHQAAMDSRQALTALARLQILERRRARDAIARRLGPHADPDYCELLATALVATFSTVTHRWVQTRRSASLSRQDAAEHHTQLLAALRLLGNGFALRDPSVSTTPSTSSPPERTP